MMRKGRWVWGSGVAALAFALAVAPARPAGAAAADNGGPDIELPAETPDEFFAEAYRKHMTGRLDEAIALYRKSIALKPTAPGHTFLGWAYAHQGRVDEAIAECEKAIQLDPDYGNPWNDIGSYLMAKGELDRAIPYLKRAMEAKKYCCPYFPHLNLGFLYAAQGKLRDARREFQRVLELKPGFPAAVAMLEQLDAILAPEGEETI